MGTYTYKTLSKTVELDNGEQAHIAVYAYKPSLWDDALNQRLHFRTGALTCDRAAEEGKRGRWVVMGYKEDDGRITIGSTAYQMPRAVGSFDDSGFGGRHDNPWPKATVVRARGKIEIVAA